MRVGVCSEIINVMKHRINIGSACTFSHIHRGRRSVAYNVRGVFT